MKWLALLSMALSAALTSAAPTLVLQNDVLAECDVSQGQFYLVTAASPICNSNSSNIPMASATSLFAPLHQSNLFLRTIGPGYFSLPVFTLFGGSLHTFSSDAFGQGNYTYSSLAPVESVELQLLQGEQGNAGLSLTGGFLLGVNGVMDQWTLCPGAVGQTVVCGY
jgi:hypothetical protein